ncbi:MAG: 50S ribosomal protein L23 [Cytophagales bacterium]|nr:MAG: 50S ribosomal protein L23 [Cytophagales bacterium]
MENIIKRPLLSEKASIQSEAGVYTFVVDRKANKIQIKKALEKMYGVEIVNINTINTASKPKMRYTSSRVVQGRTKPYKKAIVKVAEGEFIDVYGNV